MSSIAVSSIVYNLAGDINTRPNFLNTTMLGAVMSDGSQSIAEQINNAYLNGPAITLRNYAQWAISSGYTTAIGAPTSYTTLVGSVDPVGLAAALPPVVGSTIEIQNSSIDGANYEFWVQQYMSLHYPTQMNTPYTTSFDEYTMIVTLTLVSGTVITFTITGYIPGAQYLYVQYVYNTSTSVSAPVYLAYARGTGNSALDALIFGADENDYSFLPPIPVKNTAGYISATNLPTVYALAKTATTKAINANFDDVVSLITSASGSSSIDYAYMTFGVSLNTQDNSARSYIYQFFLDILNGQEATTGGTVNYAAWQLQWEAAAASYIAWSEWSQFHTVVGSTWYGTTAPTITPYPVTTLGTTGFILSTLATAVLDRNTTFNWSNLGETSGSGVLLNALGVPALPGDVWFQVVTNNKIDQSASVNALFALSSTMSSASHIRLNWQVDLNSWSCLDIYNLTMTSQIYASGTTTFYAATELANASESAFLIPLNYNVYTNMPLKDATQMATACCYLVFNSYMITSTPWYDSGWFKVLLIVVGIAITVVTGGLGGIGLLGSNLAVGMLLGLSGVAAAILGAVVNAIAAIILVQMVQVAATDVFGSQLGPIIGIIAGILALQVGTSLMNGMSASDLLSQMIQPTNLLKLTEAAGNGFAEVMQQNVQKIEAQTQTMISAYNTADMQVQDQYVSMFGTGGADLTINPLSLIDTPIQNVTQSPVLMETPQNYFNRTLMTGSDICDLSMSYISDYCSANLSTTLPNMMLT